MGKVVIRTYHKTNISYTYTSLLLFSLEEILSEATAAGADCTLRGIANSHANKCLTKELPTQNYFKKQIQSVTERDRNNQNVVKTKIFREQSTATIYYN